MAFKPLRALLLAALLAAAASSVRAGPLAYAICQTGCNALVVACYGAAGYIFGTVTAGAGVPVAILTCNSKLGVW
ncbi:hypothetical protein TSOC_008486 [Tetrabaena socialis]|uniref:Uncharacterized protein n=1 Tax=Tetrabaena socialis TaxID=47790 RepID=A0A2J7ZYD6_9CHLO|nr:hypothetical protein TSOC_008486 [Tetrabaena socialis]|eukprot:PNH05266.1 hypothetical protein TSOC_008486 [Tetrabaena socialis]